MKSLYLKRSKKTRIICNSLIVSTACFFSFALFNKSFGQGGVIAIQSKFDVYRKQDLQEKLFVHTDKNYYQAGEILWMKLYAEDAFFNRPLAFSSVAYVELLDKQNTPVLQTKIELETAHGNGSVFLPVTLASGNYKLRAYTAWMKNFSPEFYFEKLITIINAQQPIDLITVPVNKKINVAFYPEGGNLIYLLPAKVGFAVTDNYGKGVACKGVLYDDSNNEITSFQSYKFGLGNFQFTPLKGHSYTAAITLPDGIILKQPLTDIKDNGYTLQLMQGEGEKLVLNVRASEVADASSPQIYLLVHTRQAIKIVSVASLVNGIASFNIDTSLLGEGISHLTVFNSRQQPVCERLYFKQPAARLHIGLSIDQQTFEPRKQIRFELTADLKEQPEIADLSLAVYRLDSLQHRDEDGIADYLWLSSDLTGTVESASWYFKQNDSVQIAADNLMLTQGWRRFKWDDLLQEKHPVISFAPELNGHMVKGKVVDNKTGKTAAGIVGYLTVPGLKPIFKTAISDPAGTIQFALKNYYGTPGIIVQTSYDEDSVYHIEIANPFASQASSNTLPLFVIPPTNSPTLLDQSIATQVQNVYSAKNSHQHYPTANDSMPFYQYTNDSYLLDNYTRFTTIEEIFREYVPYVNVRRRNGRYHLPVFDDAKKNGVFDDDPLVLIDGLPIFNFNKLMTYDPLKIKRLDLITHRFYMGTSAFDGIINFSTYKGDLEGYELDPQATVIDYEALQLQREFYLPVYENNLQYTSHKPDFRTLLQWSPNIKTDANGRAAVSFYSSDLAGKYVGIVQGITANGNAGTGIVYFEVK